MELANVIENWASRINTEWRKSVCGILETGRLIKEALTEISHGEKEEFYSQLDFGEATAQRLMKVAGDNRLTNPAHVQLLPNSWGTLYEITKLSNDAWKYGIQKQIIQPDMQRKDVMALRDIDEHWGDIDGIVDEREKRMEAIIEWVVFGNLPDAIYKKSDYDKFAKDAVKKLNAVLSEMIKIKGWEERNMSVGGKLSSLTRKLDKHHIEVLKWIN